jgi:hypothetical protein
MIEDISISKQTLENIITSPDFTGFDSLELYERQLLYKDLIENYKSSNSIVEYALNKYFKINLEVSQIESLNKLVKISDGDVNGLFTRLERTTIELTGEAFGVISDKTFVVDVDGDVGKVA